MQIPLLGRQRILMVVTEDWYFWSHRRAVAVGALEAGYRVTVASRFGDYRERIEALGIETVPIKMRRSGRNPIGEMASVADLVNLYRRLRPDIVHHVSLKPVLYGSWAARVARVPRVINAISGLGYAFTDSGPKARVYGAVSEILFRSALRMPGSTTIFQNEEDRSYCVGRGIVEDIQTALIRGSGVDLDTFLPKNIDDGSAPSLIYIGRMLWSKGIDDLVAVIPSLREKGYNFNVILVGEPDYDNPEAIPVSQIQAWQNEGLVEWLGRRDDIPELMAKADIAVLPSAYREGIPKMLIEAAGAGLPIVTTDAPGCREAVDEGQNGFLVPVRDRSALADAIGKLLADPDLRRRMGMASRKKAEAEFSEAVVVEQTLNLYRQRRSGIE